MLLHAVFGLLVHSLTTFAQTAVPTNASIPDSILQQSQLALMYGPTMMTSQIPIAFALDFATNNLSLANTTAGKNFFLNGTIQIVTPTNIMNLTNTSIAYISCDAGSAAYNQSNLGVQQTISLAKEQMSPGTNETGAIILYTQTGQWCNYSAPDDFTYTPVFVLPGPSRAMQTYYGLSEAPQAANILNTQLRSTNGQPVNPDTGNGSGSGGSTNGMTQTTSTTVAMIILYSVTGIITLCFITVIVTGALRARRHPERYGLANLPGGAHQRRARGIARAMLETIPIVKFGEKEPIKNPTDVEQGTELQNVAPNITATRDNPDAGAETTMATEATPATEEASSSRADSSSPAAVATGGAQTDGTAEVIPDNGLACSVCTEDFIKGQDLRVLPCDHKFHPECIDPWLLNVSGTCPLCRIDLRPPEDREETSERLPTAPPINGIPATIVGTDPRTAASVVPGHARMSTFLSRHRMGEATPGQRLRALRDFRNHRRSGVASAEANATDGEISATPNESVPRSNRVSRLFSSRREDSPPTAAAAPAAGTLDGPAPASTNNSTAPVSTAAPQAINRQVPSLYQMSYAMRRGR